MLDVIIAGAGPAGSLAALVLARAGARVVLIDREPFPREKLCGDTLNPGAVRLLASVGLTGGPLATALRLRGMRLTGPGAEVTADYGGNRVGLAIRRRDLDLYLLNAAVRAGARFESGLVARRPLIDESPYGLVRGLVLSAPRGRNETRMPALMTIAADGRRSVLARSLGLLAGRPARRRWAFGTYATHLSGPRDVGEMHIRRGWYLGVAPITEALSNVCLVTPPRPEGRTPLDVIRRAIARDEALAERLAGAEFVGPTQVLGPLAADVRGAGVAGLLLAGDAAGFVDPMTGDGMHLAMQGAMLAADEALRAIADGTFAAAPERLAAARRARFGSKLRFNRWLRAGVDAPGAIRLASRGAQILPSLVAHAIRYAGDAA
jgi:flavin-dependent dehydrogenase